MIRRLPVIPTLIVLAAVAVMVRLGFWQLDRLAQKEALLARFAAAQTERSDVALPLDKAARELVWFRHTSFACLADGETNPMAGHNAKGETGWAQWSQCYSADGKPLAEVNLGWTRAAKAFHFNGGNISGTIAPDGAKGARVVTDLPQEGLEASAKPDPANIPNNHLSYAVQWFLFALTAMVIYALALRKRLAAPGGEG